MRESKVLKQVTQYLDERGSFTTAATTTLLIWHSTMHEEWSIARFAATVDACADNRVEWTRLAQVLRTILNPIEEELLARDVTLMVPQLQDISEKVRADIEKTQKG